MIFKKKDALVWSDCETDVLCSNVKMDAIGSVVNVGENGCDEKM
jgi:hypothetical protein